MIKLAIILLILGWIEFRFSPRFEYIKESSVLLFFFTAKKGVRKRVIFKI